MNNSLYFHNKNLCCDLPAGLEPEPAKSAGQCVNYLAFGVPNRNGR